MRRYLDPKLDVVFKLLFGGPRSMPILTSLLSAVLKPRSPISQIEVLNPELRKEDFNDKGIALDLLVRLSDGTQVDVEMQSEQKPAFRKRALYYWARAYGSQLEPGSEYRRLRPVAIVVFTDYRETHSGRLHSSFRVLEDHDHSVFDEGLQLHLVELPELSRMSETELAAEQRLVRWSQFLKAKTDEELEKLVEGDPMLEQAKDILAQLSMEPDAKMLARQRELARATYLIEMSSAIEEGEARGEARGEVKGEAKGRRETLRRLVEKRFGPLDDDRLARLEAADPDRVMDRLFDAGTFEELLEP